ncbi:MAG: ferredoxin [Erysipelothrix sp.]|jgi:ferredoxin|nr:ferredoxin [Clostridia bacterium]MBS3987992.1 ferredoxin [Erysipelothrix sp.]
MRVKVDDGLCIACGECIDICPEVFDWNDDGSLAISKVNEVPADGEECAKEAVESCPTEAIKEF